MTLWLAASGCSEREGTFLVVRVELTGGAPAAPLDLRQFLIEVARAAASAQVSVPDPPAAAPLPLPTTFSLEVAGSGDVTLHVEAVDAAGRVMAVGQAPARAVENGVVEVSVGLRAGPAHCGNRLVDDAPGALVVTPETDVDCGGPCLPCAAGKRCALASDCAGGACSAGRCDFATGPPHWLPGPDMPTARYGPGAATGSDGRIYVLSGHGPGGVKDTVDVLDPATDRWETIGPLSQGRYTLAGGALGDLVFAIGGTEGGNATQASTVDALDVRTGLWRDPPMKLLSPRVAPGVVSYEGRLYVLGGANPTEGSLASVEYYDARVDRWFRAADMPRARSYFGAAVGADQRLYAVGGKVDAFSFLTSQWSAAADLLPERGRQPVVAAPDGRIYSIGGDGADPGPSDILALVDAYHPAADAWAKVAPLRRARLGNAAAVAPDGRIFTFGGGLQLGASVTDPFNTTEIYGPRVTLSTTRGASGTRVLVGGENFAARARVRIYLGDPAEGYRLGSGLTDAEGRLRVPILITLPRFPTGRHRLIAIDDRSAYPAVAFFEIP